MASTVDDVRVNKLRWFGRVLKRDGTEVVKLVKNLRLKGMREEVDWQQGSDVSVSGVTSDYYLPIFCTGGGIKLPEVIIAYSIASD